MIEYNIISTGSKGNAVVINSTILIDCGVPFKSLKEIYRGLQLVLLTHIHCDHFNRTTIRKLAQERATLRWGCCEWLVSPLIECGVEKRNIDLFCINADHAYSNMIIEPFDIPHNVPNCGYKITGSQFGRVLYATDTNSMNKVEAKNYDLYMIEANYNENEIVERIRQKQKAGEYCHEWDVLHNHLSKEKADGWLYKNMGTYSQYIYMHQHNN